LPDRVEVGFDHLSWPSVNVARGGSLRLAPLSSTGTGTMRTGGVRSRLGSTPVITPPTCSGTRAMQYPSYG
ncbi:MAG: hypothetical protein ACUVS0_14015, partial [Chloroflexus sp.]